MDYKDLTIEIIESKLKSILDDNTITLSKELEYKGVIDTTDYTIHKMCGPKYSYSTEIELFKIKWSDDKDLTGIYLKHVENGHLEDPYLRVNQLTPVTVFGKNFQINDANIKNVSQDLLKYFQKEFRHV